MNSLKLEKRDTVAIICASLVLLLVLFMAFYLPVGPMKKYRQAQNELNNTRNELHNLQQLKQEELTRLQSQDELRQRLSTRPKSFDLIPFVDQVLRETALNQRAELSSSRSRANTSRQPMAELELKGVSLEELVTFLHRIYDSNNLVAIYQVDHIRPAQDNKGLDLSLKLVTLKV
ncbi:MAG: hypothetical protein HYV26_13885 [Candidatus Hydrogenedentes bacterium]|nr:hypothetical protein [Candidatus Hydrogenedentota bacterium]MBI3117102.1 hypothetical protein [Candidatus Hydrogenedentota bacterium]